MPGTGHDRFGHPAPTCPERRSPELTPGRRRGARHTERLSGALTLTAAFTPDENGWTMAQLAEWPAVVTRAPTVDDARALLLDAAKEMLASYRDEGREPPIGRGHAEQIAIDLAAA
jgi:predicted RNase H-like HicB family nuclease